MVKEMTRKTISWTVDNNLSNSFVNSTEADSAIDRAIESVVSEKVANELKKQTNISQIKDEIIGEMKKHFEGSYLSKFREDVERNMKAYISEEVSKKESYQIKMIETLAIFVSLFTFISIDFQIFKTIDSITKAIGLILILLWSLISFNFLLSDTISTMLKNWEKNLKKGDKSNWNNYIKWIIPFLFVVIWLLCSLFDSWSWEKTSKLDSLASIWQQHTWNWLK